MLAKRNRYPTAGDVATALRWGKKRESKPLPDGRVSAMGRATGGEGEGGVGARGH